MTTLLGEKFDATEAERAEGFRAMMAANAILRDRKASRSDDAELCGGGISYGDRCLRGEWVLSRLDASQG